MKTPSILLVDDNPDMIHELQENLQRQGVTWILRGASSGVNALELMRESPADIVIAEMRMQNMDGAQLLETVQERFPQTIRIVLSDHSDQGVIRRTVRCAHQFLAKPIQSEQLEIFIKRALALRQLLRNPDLCAIIGRIPQVPPLPRLFIQVGVELGNPQSNLMRIGEMIAQDMGMSARLLQLVNSPFFGLSRRVTKPEEAVVYLGVNLLKSLILFDELLHMERMTGVPEVERTRMWEHGMVVSMLVREILTDERAPRDVVETGRMTGILHDAGRLLLRELPKSIAEPQPGKDDFHDESLPVELKVFGTTHAEVGAYLLGIWGLPDDLVEAVAHHHHPGRILEGQDLVIPLALHVAEAFSRRGTGEPELDTEFIQKHGFEARVASWLEVCLEAEQRLQRKA